MGASGGRVAGFRSLAADVLVPRISCGVPMLGVRFLVRREVEDGGSMLRRTMTKFGDSEPQADGEEEEGPSSNFYFL